MTPEGKVKSWVNSTLDRVAKETGLQVYHFNVVAAGYGTSGIPDKMACIKGRLYAIEVKADKPKATPAQMGQLILATRAGAVSLIVGGKQFVMVLPDGATTPPSNNDILLNFLIASVQ